MSPTELNILMECVRAVAPDCWPHGLEFERGVYEDGTDGPVMWCVDMAITIPHDEQAGEEWKSAGDIPETQGSSIIPNQYATDLFIAAMVKWLSQRAKLETWHCGDHWHAQTVGASTEHNDELVQALADAVRMSSIYGSSGGGGS